MNTVFDHWNSYEAEVVPAEASPVQREECRRAFYAGAAAMFGLCIEAVEPDDEAAGEVNLQAIDDELKAFVRTDLRDAPQAR